MTKIIGLPDLPTAPQTAPTLGQPGLPRSALAYMRFGNPACYPAQTSPVQDPTGNGVAFDLRTGAKITHDHQSNQLQYYPDGGVGESGADFTFWHLRSTLARDVVTAPDHEYLFVADFARYWPDGDTFERQIARVGPANIASAFDANNLFQFDAQGDRVRITVAGNRAIDAFPRSVQGQRHRYAVAVKPFAQSGVTRIRRFVDGVEVGSLAVAYEPWPALPANERYLFGGNDAGSTRVVLFGRIYATGLIDVTASGRDAAEIMARLA